MSLQKRHNVRIYGYGPATLVFAHGLGCDQTMWRFMTPALSDRYTIITYDLAGCGQSDLDAYDRDRYADLHGHADDLLAIVEEFGNGPAVVIGHSVSAIIGMLATIKAPQRFAAQVMIGPSPRYIDDGDYIGGFSLEEMQELLQEIEANFLGWSAKMAPAIMGSPERPALAAELAQVFARNEPGIARHFARVTFLSDYRADVPKSSTPALILQSRQDMIAPPAVGEWLARNLPNSTLCMLDNVGHCPHMSAPSASYDAIAPFLERVLA